MAGSMYSPGVYGPGTGLDSRNNYQIGGPGLRELSMRFRASQSSTPTQIAVNQRWGADGSGYSAGTGGHMKLAIQADDGTGDPNGVDIMSLTWTPVNPHGDLEDRRYLTFPSGSPLVAGNLYHLRFTNIDASPTVNWMCLNMVYQNNIGAFPAQRQPAFTNDLAVLFTAAGVWKQPGDSGQSDPNTQQDTPVFDLVYANGGHDGQAYFGIINGSQANIGGTNMVRERFTITGGDKQINLLGARVMRTAGSGALTVTLETAAGAVIQSGTIPSSVFPLVAPPPGNLFNSQWGTLAIPLTTLTNGQTYCLRLSAPSGTNYNAAPIQQHDNPGSGNPNWGSHLLSGMVGAGADGAGGGGEKSSNGTSWSALYGGGAPIDIQVYLSGPTVVGNIYYVATNGNDSSGTGAIGAPWATLLKALNTAPTGAVIQMRGGTYANTFKNGRDTVVIENYPSENVIIQRTSIGGVLQLENSRNITIRRNASGGTFTVRSTVAGNGQSGGGIFMYYNSGAGGFTPTSILIDGIIIADIAGYGIQIVDASNVTVQNVDVSHTATGVRYRRVTGASFIQDSALHHTDRMIISDAAPDNDNGGVGIALDDGDGITVRRCSIYENHAPSVEYEVDGGAITFFGNANCVVEDCVAYNNQSFIETGTSDAIIRPMANNTIRRNLVYGRSSYRSPFPGITPSIYHRAGTNLHVYNNTFDLDDGHGFIIHGNSPGTFGAPIDGLKIKNNIVVNHQPANNFFNIFNMTSATGVEIDYNLLFNYTGGSVEFVTANDYGGSKTGAQLAAWRTASPFSDHDVWNADPLFVNRATRDYHLQAGSPAINVGLVIPGTTDGYSGVAPDLGRYESAFSGSTVGTSSVAFRFATAVVGKAAITGTATLTKGWSTAATGAQGLSAITGTGASAFRFVPTGNGKVSFTGTSTASFGWATAGVGARGSAGTSAVAFGFSTAATAVQAVGGGIAASSFRFVTAAVGVERFSGVAASAFRFSTFSVGSWTLAATAASTFTFSTAGTGTESLGAVAASTFHFSTSGVGVEAITGVAASAFGWSASRNEGPAASAFTFSTQAIGSGVIPSASTFTWTTQALGLETITGTAASSFAWTTTGSSVQGVNGTSAAAFRFSTAGAGQLDLQPGSAASEFTWQTVGAGELLLNTGVAASAFGWATQAVGGGLLIGDAASAFGWSTDAVALALSGQEGVAASAFTWSTDAAGTEGLPPPQRAASEFGWTTLANGSVFISVSGPAASTFRWSTSAVGDEFPVPGKKPKKKHHNWPWMRPDTI